jgi:hypothetical protein
VATARYQDTAWQPSSICTCTVSWNRAEGTNAGCVNIFEAIQNISACRALSVRAGDELAYAVKTAGPFTDRRQKPRGTQHHMQRRRSFKHETKVFTQFTTNK